MRSLPAHRAGIALLVVLTALVLVVVVGGGLAREASLAGVSRDVRHRSQLADDLARAAEAAALHWLATRAGRVVLSPELTEPRVEVLHDAWRAGGRDCAIRITAWDQFGMVPVRALRRGSPLRLGVPDAVLGVVDDVGSSPPHPLGIDVLDAVARGSDEVVTCPVPEPKDPRWFGDETSPSSGEVNRAEASRAIAVGGIIATHNPPPSPDRARRRSARAHAPRINVNTAPMPLLRAALRAAGRTGLEMIAESRARGRMAPVPPGTRGADEALAPSDGPELVGVSDCWAFRIDARVDGIERSWWSVFARENNTWRLVQRLMVPQ